MKWAIAIATLGLLVIAGDITTAAMRSPGSAGSAGSAVGSSPRDAAIAEAGRILTVAPVMPGSTSASAAPSATLRQPPQATSSIGLVTRARYWTVDQPPSIVDRALTARPLAGLIKTGGGGGSGLGPAGSFEFTAYDAAAKPPGVADAQLLISVSAIGDGRTGVGAYAEVTPQPTRSQAESVPTSITAATLRWVKNSQDKHPLVRTIRGDDARTLVTAFDHLRVSTLGVHGCPELVGERISATFRGDGHTWVATYLFCAEVSVFYDGHREPALTTAPFVKVLSHDLGLGGPSAS